MKIMVRRVNQSLFPIGNESRSVIAGISNENFEIEINPERKRTGLQNSCLHQFYEDISNSLNDAGYDMTQELLRQPIDLSWTLLSVKERLWRPVQTALYPNTVSTTELSTKELSHVTENIQRVLAERVFLDIPFPSRENMRSNR